MANSTGNARYRCPCCGPVKYLRHAAPALDGGTVLACGICGFVQRRSTWIDKCMLTTHEQDTTP